MQLSEMHGTAKVNIDSRTHENEKVCSRTYLLKNNLLKNNNGNSWFQVYISDNENKLLPRKFTKVVAGVYDFSEISETFEKRPHISVFTVDFECFCLLLLVN